MADDKAVMRRWASGLKAATPEDSARVADTAAEVIVRNEWTTVLTFLAMPGEVDLTDLHGRPGFRFLVTRTPKTGDLTLHELASVDSTGLAEVHAFGYRQPAADAPEVSPGEIEVVLVPGVLFDRKGGRLGHGKGYYDRLLGGLRPRPFLIGVTLERRIVPEVPVSPSDIRMDALITERGFSEVASF